MNKKCISILIVSGFFLTTILSINSVNAAPGIILTSGSADLQATASGFIHNGVRPNAIRNDILYVWNAGDANTELSWRISVIYNNPSDVGWIKCTPSSGSNLEPSEGRVTINIRITASEEENIDRWAKIKAINIEDSSDYRVFNVQMGTGEASITESHYENIIPIIYISKEKQSLHPFIHLD